MKSMQSTIICKKHWKNCASSGKSCNHKQNIKGLYNEKLHNNSLQQLPTLRLKTLGNQEIRCLRKLGNSDEKKWKAQTKAQYPVSSLYKPYSHLAENSQKATLNFHFKSRFSVKSSKFKIYFAKDYSLISKTDQVPPSITKT